MKKAKHIAGTPDVYPTTLKLGLTLVPASEDGTPKHLSVTSAGGRLNLQVPGLTEDNQFVNLGGRVQIDPAIDGKDLDLATAYSTIATAVERAMERQFKGAIEDSE